MKNKYVFTAILLLLLTVLGIGISRFFAETEGKAAGQEESITVVTSFYPMYIIAKNVVGETGDVTLTNLSEPQTGCLHDYQLRPEDSKLLSTADVFIVNGGGIESFLTGAAKSNEDLKLLNVGEALSDASFDENEAEPEAALQDPVGANARFLPENPHYWMDMTLYRRQVEIVARGLSNLNPANAVSYRQNAKAYLDQIDALILEAEPLREQAKGEPVVLFHEAYEYLAAEFGMESAGTLNLDEERQVSAGEIADILGLIREKKVKIILAEALYGKNMGDTIEKESDCRVYYLDPLVRGTGEADSWLEGMRKNMERLKEALSRED